MFTDPQSVTINTVAQTLPRISSAVNSGVFQKDDTTVRLAVSHQYGSRTRRQLRLDFSKIAPDQFLASTNVKLSMSVYMVVDTPPTGFTIVEQKQIVDAFSAYLTASSGGNVTKLLGGEN